MLPRKFVYAWLYVAMPISLLILAGCALGENSKIAKGLPDSLTATPSTSPGMTSTAAVTNPILHGWLSATPCSPPCWQGIVPGKTGETESLAVLQGMPDVIYQVYRDDRGTTINWYLQGPIEQGGVISIEGVPALVRGVKVGQDSTFTLQQVIDVYGEPSHVFATARPCTDLSCTVYRLSIVFIEQGFALSWSGSPTNSVQPEFDPNWKDFHVLFFEPTLEDFGVAWGNPTITADLTAWKGMVGFDAYCQGERCDAIP